jgi:hypothetical protein
MVWPNEQSTYNETKKKHTGQTFIDEAVYHFKRKSSYDVAK